MQLTITKCWDFRKNPTEPKNHAAKTLCLIMYISALVMSRVHMIVNDDTECLVPSLAEDIDRQISTLGSMYDPS